MTMLFISKVHDPKRWIEALRRHEPTLDLRIHPDIGRPEDIRFALAWDPPAGLLATLPNLIAVSSFGAGVEHLLNDPDLPPRLPVLRIVDERLTGAMSEYVMLHVLRLHRRLDFIRENQRNRIWQWFPTAITPETTVGVMGLGALGTDAGRKLAAMGFRVIGWSRTPKSVTGVECFVGEDQRDAFLALCDFLVCLLPLTADTRGILNRTTLGRLPRGAHLINVGRGGHLVEPDLLEMLDSGHIASATLDVAAIEPLPPGHPFWTHPKIVVTPHNAADTNPVSASAQIIENYRRALAAEPLMNVVDRALGY